LPPQTPEFCFEIELKKDERFSLTLLSVTSWQESNFFEKISVTKDLSKKEKKDFI